ncbi:MAG: hypothetical protein FWE84_05035 [Firmicutes bacterium]|nr:hypothetical protein [Bacillota bacterium]
MNDTQNPKRRGRGRPPGPARAANKPAKTAKKAGSRAAKTKEYKINFSALDAQGKELYSSIFQGYDDSSIYELREIARRIGVKSATTMDKRTLVIAMSERRMANTVYCPPQAGIVAPVIYEEVEMITDDYLMRTAVLDPESRMGILDITNDGAWLRTTGFVQSDADVFVPMLMVNDYRLESGDELTGQARFMDKSGRFGLFKLETINGTAATGFIRKRLEKPVSPTSVLKLSKGSRTLNALNVLCPLSKGQRKLIIGLGALKLDGLAREISIKLHEKGFVTINLFLDESHETMRETADLPGISLVLACDSFERYDEAIRLAVDYAKRIAPYGKDVVMILNNADVLCEETLRAVYGAGRCSENGSITTVIISSALELNPLINRLSRTANSIAILKNNIGADPMVDIKRSFSEIEERLSAAERQTLSDLRKQMSEPFVNVRDLAAAYEIILADNQKKD